MKGNRLYWLIVVLLGLTFSNPVFAQERQTALDRYLAQKDAVYGWKRVNMLKGNPAA